MKLEFEHLAPYISHNLKLRYKNFDTNRYITATLHGISKDCIETTYIRKINGCSGDIISFKGNNNIIDMGVYTLLKSIHSLTKEDWKSIFYRGLEDYPEVIEDDAKLKIFINSETVRLYDEVKGFRYTLPTETIVSFSKPTLQFGTIYKFNMIKAFNRLHELHVDLYNLIENNLAININN